MNQMKLCLQSEKCDTSMKINMTDCESSDLYDVNDVNDVSGLSDLSESDNEENDESEEIEERKEEYIISTYRFKFTDEFMKDLHIFSKIHQYDDRKSFKEAWKIWIEDSEEIVKKEEQRMQIIGYKGDVIDKMFKSARYYFRKKSAVPSVQKERRKYVGINKDLLLRMDIHIKNGLMDKSKGCKPHTGFLNFCETNLDVLKETIDELCNIGIKTPHDIQCKIKKTYKNRYSMIILHSTC